MPEPVSVIPHVVTTLSPNCEGGRAPPSRTVSYALRSWRTSCVRTTATWVAPRAGALSMCAASSQTSAPSLNMARNSTARPPMWLADRQGNQTGAPLVRSAAWVMSALALSASHVSCAALGSALEPEVNMTRPVSSSTDRPPSRGCRPSESMIAVAPSRSSVSCRRRGERR
jgi:hypothetical protein